jgi:hypothetical protein
MEPAQTTVQAPVLPFTVHAGRQPLRTMGTLLRARGWVLGVVAIVPGILGLISGGVLAGLVAIAWIAGLCAVIVGVGAFGLLLYGRSTITVTHTELIVKRVRRRVLPRADFGEIVLGFFTVQSSDGAGLQLLFADRDGDRFATTPLFYWPAEGLDQLCAALGTTPRWQDDSEHDRKLRPFYVRHMFLVAFAGAMVLIAIIVGVIVLVDHYRAGQREEAAQTAEHSWQSYAEKRLGSDVVPLDGRPEISTYVPDDTKQRIDLDVRLSLVSPGTEADPAVVARAREAVCAFHPDLGKELLRTELRLAFERDRSDHVRVVHTVCGLDQSPLDRWLRAFASAPFGEDVADVDVTFDARDGFDGKTEPVLEAEVGLSTQAPAALGRTMDHVCGVRLGEVTTMISYDWRNDATGRSRRARDVHCERLDEAMQEWGQAEQ